MVTKEQLAKSLAIQKKLEKPVGLGAIFLKKGYITREQLEEIVKQHNDGGDGKDAKNGAEAKPKKKGKKKKKKAKGDATASEASSSTASEASSSSSADAAKPAAEASSQDASSSDGAAPTAKKDDDAKKDEASSEEPPKKRSSKVTPAIEPAADVSEPPGEAPPKVKSKKIDKETVQEKTASKKSGREPSASESEIDSTLLESAPPSDTGEVDDPSKRVVGCQKCSKKYRVKKRQAGKRFNCRQCKARVKIPKELFDDAVAVTEFDPLADDEESASGDGKAAEKKTSAREKKQSGSQPVTKKSATATAVAAPAPAPAKDNTIAELAKAAIQKKPAALLPRQSKKSIFFGYIQAVVALTVVAALVGGVVYWKWSEHQAALAAKEADKHDEWERFRAPFDAAVKGANDALAKAKDGAADPNVVQELTNAISTLDVSRRPVVALEKHEASEMHDLENVTKALKHDEEVHSDALMRSLYLARGRLAFDLGTESGLNDAAHDFAEIVARDSKNDEALVLLGRVEIRRRNYAAAMDALKKALALNSQPGSHALYGLACEAADVIKEAVREYDPLGDKEPLGKVLKARALTADNDTDAALAAITDVIPKLQGEPLAAAHVQRGLALERKGDDGATASFDEAVKQGGDSGRALVARGEHHLRFGRFDKALQDFDAALKAAGGARAAVGLGEARQGLLDRAGAMTAWRQALTLKNVKSGALLGDVDVFDDPHAPDPRAVAQRHLAADAYGGRRMEEARALFEAAIAIDAFDPESRARLADLEISAKNLTAAENHLKNARALLASGNDKNAKGEIVLVRGPATATLLRIEARFYDAKGELPRAIQALDGVTEADPTAPAASIHALKGHILRRQGAPVRDQRTEFLRALELETSGKDPVTRLYLQAADLFAKAEKGDAQAGAKAGSVLDTVLATESKHAHALYLRAKLAVLLAQSDPQKYDKKWDDALKAFSDSLDANPDFLDALIARGFFYVRDLPEGPRRPATVADRATEDFTHAIELDDKSVQSYYGRALANNVKAATQFTLQDLDVVLKLDKNFALAYKLRAEVRRRSGQEAKAKEDDKEYERLKK
jgi:tetratricopeptide (TPR) repeat protein